MYEECNARIVLFSEAEIINFFGKKSIKEFVVESYSMKISENNRQTTLKEICFTKMFQTIVLKIYVKVIYHLCAVDDNSL